MLLENMGLITYKELFFTLMKLEYTQSISDENITVMDTTFSDLPVPLYLPKRKSESQRQAVINGCVLFWEVVISPSYRSKCVCVLYIIHIYIQIHCVSVCMYVKH